MTKKLSFDRPNRRDFLRTGIVGGTGLVVAQFAIPKELRAQTTTWSGQVSQSSDDAYELIKFPANTTSTTIDLVNSSESGFRFQNVTVPNSATITAASISFNVTAGPGTCSVYLQAVDNAPTFMPTLLNLDRPHTVNYANFASGTGWTSSGDLSAAVQEVVNRQPVGTSTGWVSGNAMAVLAIPTQGLLGRAIVTTYDDDPIPPPNLAAILTIQYT